VPFVQGYAAFVAGLTAGDDASAIGHLEAALVAFQRIGLLHDEGRTRLELARRRSAIRPELAVADAKAALSIFDQLGAAPDGDAAAALLRSLGVRGRTGPRDAGLLSKREQAVLQLLGDGLSNPEIAARLFISRKTAAHHVSSVLAKLGLRNRAEAATFARSSAPSETSPRSGGAGAASRW
jgi:DNA-binding CsgD family transcriptional regulator